MADQQELQILLTTQAQTAGATQTKAALQQVKAEALATQQALSPRAQFANDLLRQVVAAHGGATAETVQRARETVSKSTGVAPTLSAADFGLVEQAATKTAAAVKTATGATQTAVTVTREHIAVQKESGEATAVSETHLLRFGAALFGVSAGLSLFTTAGNLIKNAITGIIQTEVDAQRATRELSAAYGAAAADFEKFAGGLSKSKDAFGIPEIEQATLALRPLGEQFQFTRSQIQDLVSAASHLADIHEIPLIDATKALDAAIRGNSSAADALGLSLSDVQVAQRAAAQGMAGTFPALTDQQKALLRLSVALQEVDQQQARVVNSAAPLSESQRAASTAIANLNKATGPGAVAAASAVADAIAQWAIGVTHLGEAADTAQKPVAALNFQVSAAAREAFPALPTAVDKVAASLENLGRAGPATPTITQFLSDLEGEAGRAQQRLGELQAVILNVADADSTLSAATAQSRAEIALVARERAAQSPGNLEGTLNVALQQAQSDSERQQITARLQGLAQLRTAFDALGRAEQDQAVIQRQSILLSAAQAQAELSVFSQNQAVTSQQNRITRDQLVAQDRLGQSPEARAAARRDARTANRQLPGLELTAFDANEPVRVAQINAARGQLAGQVAAGAAAQAQQRVDVVMSGDFTVNINGPASLIPADQEDRIAQAALDQFTTKFAEARRQAENASSTSLVGVRTP